MSGQLGQLFSVVPFAIILHASGWTPAFLMLAAMSGLAVVLVLVLLQDLPPGHRRPRAVSPGLRATGRFPGPRVAAARHPAGHVEPLHRPVQRHGLRHDVGLPLPASPRRGWTPARFYPDGLVCGRWHAVPARSWAALWPGIRLRRSTMVLLISAATAAAWAAVLLMPGRSPLWLLAGLVVVLAIGGPGSMIGFDFARTFNPAHRMGTATGIVNVGGFIACTRGHLPDRPCPGRAVRRRLFRGPVWPRSFPGGPERPLHTAGGRGRGDTCCRRKVRRQMAAQGVVVPPLLSALARQRRRTWRGAARTSLGRLTSPPQPPSGRLLHIARGSGSCTAALGARLES